MKIETALTDFNIRSSNADDCPLILQFIKELAEYEKLSHEVVATPQILQQSLFGERPYAEVLIGEYQATPVAYALFFHNLSTFTGRPASIWQTFMFSLKCVAKALASPCSPTSPSSP